MVLKNKRIGVGMTGSFCTYTKSFEQIDCLLEEGAILQTIFSDTSQHIKCRFGKGEEFVKKAYDMTGNEPMKTIEEAEIIGPTGCLDVLVLMPCTGNTMAKLANGITDTPVLMAAKAHLRNNRPLVVALSTNDALGMNLKNIGILLNTKNIYFIPFGQDNYKSKPNSMIAHIDLLTDTIEAALEARQLQPVIQGPDPK